MATLTASGPTPSTQSEAVRPGLVDSGRPTGRIASSARWRTVGSLPISPAATLRALVAPDNSEAAQIVTELRVPRTLLGLAVGAALGVSGALIQALTRNPLADPGILGVNAWESRPVARPGPAADPCAGEVLLDGRLISAYPTKEVARRLGLLAQTSTAPEGITVANLVARGRFPHQGLFRQWSRDDEVAVREALEATGTLELSAAGSRISPAASGSGSGWR